jgi:nitronate monooxygenase
MRNALTDLLQIDSPIIQAPMAGGGDTVELVAAVSGAGALGSIGAAYLTPVQILSHAKAVRARTSRPFGINLFAPEADAEISHEAGERARMALAPYYAELGLELPPVPETQGNNFDELFAACMETDASVFSFTFGMIPKTAATEVKRRRKVLIGTATTVDEAMALVDLGVDAVVAQGSEAGGHRGSFRADFTAGMVGTMPLVPQICDAVAVPVIASGGIMDGRGIVAALALGASAVQMGTAFLVCEEAGISQAHKDAILNAREDHTRITRAFSGRPARGIANRFLVGMEGKEEDVLPFPLQNTLTRPMRSEATRQNRAEYLSLWAGQGVRLSRRGTAAELVARLRMEMERTLQTLASTKR